MVNSGKMRAAVRMATDREGGGPLQPRDIDAKTGKTVLEVLRDKHPEMMIPDVTAPGWLSFESYDDVPAEMMVDCDQEIVQGVTGKLRGGAGPSPVDGLTLGKWLLNYGTASQALREEMALWTEIFCNEALPWAMVRALLAARMVPLAKKPAGVRPVAIGEAWRRCISKCALTAGGADAKAACGSDQLCAGLEAGIEGGIGVIHKRAMMDDGMIFSGEEVDDDVWATMADEGELQTPGTGLAERAERAATAAGAAEVPLTQDWQAAGEGATDDHLLLLVDAKNAFNSGSKMAMLWTVRHLWPRMSRFALNCYRHQIRMVIRISGESAVFILSKEGVAQGDPFAMALYGIMLLPLIAHLKRMFPKVLQPWFADDGAMDGEGSEVAACFVELNRIGHQFGYYPEVSKSIAVCPLESEARLKAIFAENNLPVEWRRGHRYLGGHIGSKAMETRFVAPMVEQWVHGVEVLARIAGKYPQAAYHGFATSLQAEWQYMSRAVPGLGDYLQPIEDAIGRDLIPALLGCTAEQAAKPDFRTLLGHGVKQGGLNLRNPVTAAPRLRQSSVEATAVLVRSLLEGAGLDTVEHMECVKEARLRNKKDRVLAEEAEVTRQMAGARGDVRKRLERIGDCGAWITATPDKLQGTLLSRDEWRDSTRLRYGMRPLGLQDRCDACGCGFSIEHGLSCKTGGLVGLSHNDVRDEAGGLSEAALGKTYVSYEPMIFSGTDVWASQPGTPQGPAARRGTPGDDARGDVLVHGLWKKGEGCVLDVRITDTDQPTYRGSSSEKVLERQAKAKKDFYLQACVERRRSFAPLVYSVDGMAAKEAKAFEKRVASLLAEKWRRHYSEMVGFVRARMSLAVVRGVSLKLRGSRTRKAYRPEWTDGAAAEGAIRGQCW